MSINRRSVALLLLALTACILIYYARHSYTATPSFVSPITRNITSDQNAIPRKIWQTWKNPMPQFDDELRRFANSWMTLNPGYRYELLTDDSALTYVQSHFSHRPDIIDLFTRLEEGILRADFMRYLVLLAEGGLYTDVDTHCTRPIDEWIPAEFRNSASLVLGIEYDAQGGDIRGDMNLPVQLCQWTILAKPGNAVLQHVVDRVTEGLRALRSAGKPIAALTPREVLYTTGPVMFTKAIIEQLSHDVVTGMSYPDISNLTEPKLIADVLFLPVSAFASGQSHSGSKDWDNDEQLLSHHWRGTWKEDTTWSFSGNVS